LFGPGRKEGKKGSAIGKKRGKEKGIVDGHLKLVAIITSKLGQEDFPETALHRKGKRDVVELKPQRPLQKKLLTLNGEGQGKRSA